MATGGDLPSAERRLSDKEFEELLQKTWELVEAQNQQAIALLCESTESRS